MKISIIIPVYNQPREIFLNTISSIIQQNYADFELIIVDDGSKEEMANLIDDVALADLRIKVIHQKNGGEGNARNVGIMHASGEYIMFVDADDYVANNWIKTGIELAESKNADIVCGKMQQCYSHPETLETDEKYETLFFTKEKIKKVQYDMFLEHSTLISGLEYIDFGACAKIIKRSCIGDVRFNEDMKLSTDQIFCHQILNNAKSFVLTNKNAYYYLTNPQSVSHQGNPEALNLMMKAMLIVKSLLLDQSVKDAFYFHVIEDFQRALDSVYFIQNSINIINLRDSIKKELKRPIVREAFSNIDYRIYWSKHKKVRSLMLKHNLLFLFIITKKIYRKLKNADRTLIKH